MEISGKPLGTTVFPHTTLISPLVFKVMCADNKINDSLPYSLIPETQQETRNHCGGGVGGGSTVLRNRVMKQATTGEYRGGTLVRKGVTSIHVNKEIR